MQEYISKDMQLIYNNSKGNVSIRNIRVLASGDKRFLAYCYTSQAVRTFNRSGIVDVEVLGGARRHHSQGLSDAMQ